MLQNPLPAEFLVKMQELGKASSESAIDDRDTRTNVLVAGREQSGVGVLDISKKEKCISKTLGENEKGTSQPSRVGYGLFLIIVSSMSFTISSAIVNWMSAMGNFEDSAFRFLGSNLPAICMLLYRSEDIFPVGKLWLLLSIGVFSFFTVTPVFYAFQNMPLGDATAIYFSAPMFTSAIGCCVLGQKCILTKIISVALSIIGVVIVTQPPFLFHQSLPMQDLTDYFIAALAALIGAFSMAVSTVLFSQVKELPLSVKQFHYSALPLTACLFFCWVQGTWQFPEDNLKRFALLCVSLISFSNMTMITSALKYISPDLVSITRCADIIFSYAVQIIIFKQETTAVQIVGCLIIILAIVVSSLNFNVLES